MKTHEHTLSRSSCRQQHILYGLSKDRRQGGGEATYGPSDLAIQYQRLPNHLIPLVVLCFSPMSKHLFYAFCRQRAAEITFMEFVYHKRRDFIFILDMLR